MINYISAYRLQATFMGLHFEAYQLGKNSKLRVMIAELQLNSKQHSVTYANRKETSHIKES